MHFICSCSWGVGRAVPTCMEAREQSHMLSFTCHPPCILRQGLPPALNLPVGQATWLASPGILLLSTPLQHRSYTHVPAHAAFENVSARDWTPVSVLACQALQQLPDCPSPATLNCKSKSRTHLNRPAEWIPQARQQGPHQRKRECTASLTTCKWEKVLE